MNRTQKLLRIAGSILVVAQSFSPIGQSVVAQNVNNISTSEIVVKKTIDNPEWTGNIGSCTTGSTYASGQCRTGTAGCGTGFENAIPTTISSTGNIITGDAIFSTRAQCNLGSVVNQVLSGDKISWQCQQGATISTTCNAFLQSGAPAECGIDPNLYFGDTSQFPSGTCSGGIITGGIIENSTGFSWKCQSPTNTVTCQAGKLACALPAGTGSITINSVSYTSPTTANVSIQCNHQNVVGIDPNYYFEVTYMGTAGLTTLNFSSSNKTTNFTIPSTDWSFGTNYTATCYRKNHQGQDGQKCSTSPLTIPQPPSCTGFNLPGTGYVGVAVNYISQGFYTNFINIRSGATIVATGTASNITFGSTGSYTLTCCADNTNQFCTNKVITITTAPVCGDGIKNQVSEQCDDNNLINGDGCSDTCTYETPSCSLNISPTTLTAGGIVTATTGSTPSWVTVSNYNRGEGSPIANPIFAINHTYNTVGGYTVSYQVSNSLSGSMTPINCNVAINVSNTPINGVCNSSVNGQVFYTGTIPNSSAYCTSGNVQIISQTSTGVTWNCQNLNGGTNQNGCNLGINYCGNATIQGANGEQCDAGSNNGTTCSPTYGSTCTYCTTTCQNTVLTGAYCGDTIQNGTEQCDDGNSNNDDACNNSCQINSPICGGASGSYLVTQTSYTMGMTFCAGGTASPLNPAFPNPGQTISWSCALGSQTVTCGAIRAICPSGQTYNSSTNNCDVNPYCGDGSVNQGSEQCDDGNTNNNDGCTNTCTYETPSCVGVNFGPTSLNPGGTSTNTITAQAGFTATSLTRGEGSPISNPPASSNHIYNTVGTYNAVVTMQSNFAGGPSVQCPATITVSNAPIPGVCNSSIVGNTYYAGSEPSTSSLCSNGNLTSLSQGANGWTWSCNGVNGGTSQNSCSLNRTYCGNGSVQSSNGEQCDDGNSNDGDGCSNSCQFETPSCGGANGRVYSAGDSTFAPYSLCALGTPIPTPSFPSAGASVSWTCNNGPLVSPTCSASRASAPVDAICGNASNGAGGRTYAHDVTSFGSNTFCAAGTVSPTNPLFPTQGGNTSWTCLGINGGNASTCSANRDPAPVCGSANKTYASTDIDYGSDSFCSPGVSNPNPPAFPTAGGAPVTWTCASPNGGSTVSCSATRPATPIPGVCNSSIVGNTYYAGSEPSTSSLCSNGNLTSLSQGANGWTWSCNGVNGGTSQNSCSLNRTYCGNGSVQSSNGEQCDDGNSNDGDGCSNSCQFETPSCSAVNFNPTFGFPNGSPITNSISFSSWYTATLLNWGDGNTQPNPAPNNNHVYSSAGVYNVAVTLSSNFAGGPSIQCPAQITIQNEPIPGVCNSSIVGNSYYAGTEPNPSTLCSNGNLASLSQGANGWTWSCNGVNGGTSQNSCSLNRTYCGNGSVQSSNGEQCDDGNSNNGDGCTSTCMYETPSCSAVSFSPLFGPAGTAVDNFININGAFSAVFLDWGNGVTVDNPGGFNTNRYFNAGTYDAYVILQSNIGGGPSVTCPVQINITNTPIDGICGGANGKMYQYFETQYAPDVQCYQGNSSNTSFPSMGVGVPVSISWNCVGINGGATVTCGASRLPAPTCGDGIPGNTAGEQCDDGNSNNDDACNNACQNNQARCVGTNQCAYSSNTALAACGQNSDCQIYCTDPNACNNGQVGTCSYPNQCGCSGGDTNDSDGDGVANCVDSCSDTSAFNFNAISYGNVTCQYQRCVGTNSCGTSASNGGTACNNNNDCGPAPTCGDGIPGNTAGEQCDDGNSNNDDACNNACQNNQPRCVSNNQCAYSSNTALAACNNNNDCLVCTDPNACNNGQAGTCSYPNQCGCSGGDTNDSDGDGVANCVDSCSDTSAFNFNAISYGNVTCQYQRCVGTNSCGTSASNGGTACTQNSNCGGGGPAPTCGGGCMTTDINTVAGGACPGSSIVGGIGGITVSNGGAEWIWQCTDGSQTVSCGGRQYGNPYVSANPNPTTWNGGTSFSSNVGGLFVTHNAGDNSNSLGNNNPITLGVGSYTTRAAYLCDPNAVGYPAGCPYYSNQDSRYYQSCAETNWSVQCPSGETWNGSACVGAANYCAGTPPANATWCNPPDGSPTQPNQPVVGIVDCVAGGTTRCKYECNSNYNLQPDGSCAPSCTQTNGGVEICDGIDNNCNGSVDEGLSCGGTSADICNQYGYNLGASYFGYSEAQITITRPGYAINTSETITIRVYQNDYGAPYNDFNMTFSAGETSKTETHQTSFVIGSPPTPDMIAGCSGPGSTCQDPAANNYGGGLPCTYSCSNGATNYPACDQCPSGQQLINGQCINTPSCNYNGQQDNGETGIDCGGGNCGSCPPTYSYYCVFNPNTGIQVTTNYGCNTTADCNANPQVQNAVAQGASSLAPVACQSEITLPIPASCGGAARNFDANTNTYAPFSICAVGTPSSNPNFPSQGGSVSWSCVNGNTSAYCTATRDQCPSGETWNGSSCVGSTCQDPVANNYGGGLPCTYSCSNGATNYPACDQCPSGQQLINGQCINTPSCNYNGQQDNGETGIDCGGGNCGSCPPTTCQEGIFCNNDIDCGGVGVGTCSPFGAGCLCGQCGNGTCDNGETNATCPSDCPSNSADGVCGQNGGCNVGTSVGDNGLTACDTNRIWTCNGNNGGANAPCSQYNGLCGGGGTPIDGVCSSNGYCVDGIAANDNGVTCGGTHTWNCNGIDGGANAPCSESTSACNPVYGCTNPGSCNYNSLATINDGSCASYDCAGTCGGGATTDCNGTCNGGATTCTDFGANNYGSCGSCTYNPSGPVCGNNSCESGEDCNNCAGDCGSCPPAEYCGDGSCNNGEDGRSCSIDCGCPNGADNPPNCDMLGGQFLFNSEPKFFALMQPFLREFAQPAYAQSNTIVYPTGPALTGHTITYTGDSTYFINYALSGSQPLTSGQIIDQLNQYECYVGGTISNSAGVHNHAYTFFSGSTQINPVSGQNYCGIRIVMTITPNSAQSPAIMPDSRGHASFKTVYLAGAFGTTIDNCVSSTPAQGNTSDNNSCARTTITDLPKADPFIMCSVTPPSTISGGVVIYTCTYGNNGPDSATGVVVTFPFPTGFTPSTGSVTYTSTGVVIPVGTQGVGTGGTFVITGVVIGNPGDVLVTTGVVTGQSIDTNLSNNKSPVQVTITATPSNDLSVVKVINKTGFKEGELVTYQIIATNNGIYIDTGVVITDIGPSQLTHVSSNPAYSSVVGNIYSWTGITLAPGASTSITLTGLVKSGTIIGSNFVNLAIVSGTLPDPILNNTGTATGTVTKNTADPFIVCEVSVASVVTNTTISYTCTYGNNGPDSATGVVVTFPFPTGFTPSTGSVTYTSTGVVIPVGTQGVGTGGTFVITGVVIGNPGDVLVTTGVVTGQSIDTNLNNNKSPVMTVITAIPTNDLGIIKLVNTSTGKVGDYVKYTITATNHGAYTDTGVTIIDIWPSQLTYVSSNPAYSSVVGNIYSWTGITLAPGASTSITLTGQINNSANVGSAITNVAVVSGSLQDTNLTNNTGSQTGGVVAPQTDPYIVCTVVPNNIFSGNIVAYTCTYGNNGPDTATGVVVTLPFTTGFTPTTGTVPFTSGGVIANVGILPIGPGGSFTITGIIAGNPGTNVITTGVISSITPDTNLNNNTSPVIVTITAPIVTDPYIITQVTKGTGVNSNLLTYTITYGNHGPYTASGSVVTIQRPNSQVTFGGTGLVFNVGDLPVGFVGQIILTGTIKSGIPDGQTIVLTGVITTTTPFINPQDDSDEVYTNYYGVNLTVTKNIDKSIVSLGDLVTYTIKYANVGTALSTNVKLTDILPTGIRFESANILTSQPTTGTIIMNLGTVLAGESGTIILTGRVVSNLASGTILTNNVMISGTELDIQLSNNNDSVSTTVKSPVLIVDPVECSKPLSGAMIGATSSMYWKIEIISGSTIIKTISGFNNPFVTGFDYNNSATSNYLMRGSYTIHTSIVGYQGIVLHQVNQSAVLTDQCSVPTVVPGGGTFISIPNNIRPTINAVVDIVKDAILPEALKSLIPTLDRFTRINAKPKVIPKTGVDI